MDSLAYHDPLLLYNRLCIGIYNPLFSLVSLMVLPITTIYLHAGDLPAILAKNLGDRSLYNLVIIDAIIVLCGGVITSLIGVSGLLKRCAADRILPAFFSYTNSRGGAYAAVAAFIALAISLFLTIFDPSDPSSINQFGGVYAMSFLSVMTAFVFSAILLKWWVTCS